MKIALGSDHGGFRLKSEIIVHLKNKGIEYKDLVICGTGIGISIAANKVPGIRAALCGDCFSAKVSREHNDANVLALGERVIGTELAKMIVDIWLETEFIGGRHKVRVDKLNKMI